MLEKPDANIGIRLPDDVIGVDVDAYGDKPGEQRLADLEARLGPLPPTARDTSRLSSSAQSGIRLYRVGPGHGWADPGPGVEAIHAGGRCIAA